MHVSVYVYPTISIIYSFMLNSYSVATQLNLYDQQKENNSNAISMYTEFKF